MQLENFEDIGKCKLFLEITNSWNFVLDHLVSENEISENILKKVRKYLLHSSISFTCVVAKQLFFEKKPSLLDLHAQSNHFVLGNI